MKRRRRSRRRCCHENSCQRFQRSYRRLAKINSLFLLKEMFQEIHVPEAVFREVTQDGWLKPGAEAVRKAPWILRKEVSDRIQVHFLMTVLEEGEAEVLVLAKELQADLILLDEEKARKSAVLAGFSVMGVIGILIAAKRLISRRLHQETARGEVPAQ